MKMNSEKVYAQLEALNESNSSKFKLDTLKAFKDDAEFQKVFKYTYDKVDYVFGVSVKTVEEYSQADEFNGDMFELLDALAQRKITGNSALGACRGFIEKNPECKDLFLKIINRDLKVNVSEKTLNKIWKNIVPKPSYCRCAVLDEKLASKIKFPCYIQLKCDGTYRECYVQDGKVSFKTRSGEPYSNPVLEKELAVLPNGYYTGEFTIGCGDDPSANRSAGNGMINSDNPPFADIHFTIWDYLTEDEYNGTVKTPYGHRFENLKNNLRNVNSELVHVVPSYVVNSLSEALYITSDFMNKGLEGGVLKDKNMIFKNGTSNQQLKIKLKVDADLRVVGFLKGTKGTKYENMNKVIVYKTDDGLIQGQCSGMTDTMCEEVTKNPSKYIGQIVAVQFNDLIKAEEHDYHALSHPRFQEFRIGEKDVSDTFERIVQLRDMAKSLS